MQNKSVESGVKYIGKHFYTGKYFYYAKKIIITIEYYIK